jgi:hypothetical protein
MASLQATARTEEFQREQSRKTVTHVQRNIEDFERLAARLDSEIRAEEERTRVIDPSRVAYSMFAKAARARRENLQRSCEDLRLHLESIRATLDEAPEELSAA